MDILIFLAIPVFLLSIGAELLYARHAGMQVYHRHDTWANLAMGVGNVLTTGVAKAVILGGYFLVYEFRLFEIPATAWWAWLLLLFADDFCYYWFHRMHHRVRMLWCTHVNHHSSEHFNFAVALRQPWTEPVTAPWFWLALPLLGFHPLMVLTQQAINLLYQFFVHTQLVRELGWYERIFNTPSHHRVHHGTNPQYLDKNYGGIFIFWDRLFGTFEPEREPVKFGLVHNLATYNPFRIAFHEWAALVRDVWRARGLRARLRYAFAAPSDLNPADRATL